MAVEAAGPPDEPPSAIEIERTLGGAGGTATAPDAPLGQSIATQSIVVPFVAEGGHILIEASLDGHSPRPFILDSGARTTVTPEAAQDLASAAQRPRTSWEGTGLIFDKPEHAFFEIIDVLPGTAAERAGLRSGDRVVAINGHPARDLGLSDIGTINGPLGKEMTIETVDGQRFDLAVGQILP